MATAAAILAGVQVAWPLVEPLVGPLIDEGIHWVESKFHPKTPTDKTGSQKMDTLTQTAMALLNAYINHGALSGVALPDPATLQGMVQMRIESAVTKAKDNNTLGAPAASPAPVAKNVTSMIQVPITLTLGGA